MDVDTLDARHSEWITYPSPHGVLAGYITGRQCGAAPAAPVEVAAPQLAAAAEAVVVPPPDAPGDAVPSCPSPPTASTAQPATAVAATAAVIPPAGTVQAAGGAVLLNAAIPIVPGLQR